jgi:hypothetical protein
MDWEEVRSRASQEGSKQLDLILYRTGQVPRTQALPTPPMRRARFFGADDRDDIAHRSALLRAHLPDAAAAIIHEADSICRHEFHLLGYDKLQYGPHIDWHSDPVHKKRAPLKPWFKIKFLDFHEAGDHKIIWELNRHQHLITLAKAWNLTGNRTYTTELVQQWYSWQQANPYPLGLNWASTLEVAFRAMSWLWVRQLLTGCADLSAAFQSDLRVALQLHGRYIERYLSTYFSPNTHLLGEAAALLFLGILCPEMPAAERWQNQGWRILVKESERQVRPDGVYFEQTLYYHVYALDFFLHARHLAGENGLAIPGQFDRVLKKMLEVVQALCETGPPVGFGDDDGGRVFDPRRNQVECMGDPLALGSVLYESEKYPAARLTEEAIWLFGDKAVETLERPHPQPPALSKAFVSGGIYLMNDHLPCTQQCMVDAGPQGIGHSGHGHADALSIRLSLDGRRFLVDPGTYCYISDSPDRDWFRGTGAHNTLRVDNLDQAVPQGPFAWSSIPNVSAETWINGQTFDYFVGSHDGYRRLPDPVLHRRSVFHVKGGFWFVRDLAEGHGKHLLESLWHFAPDLQVREEERGISIARSSPADASAGHCGLTLLIDGKSAWKTQIAEAFVSPAYGSRQVAPMLVASVNATLPEDCGVLLLPAAPLSGIGTFAAIDESSVGGVRGYRYHTPQATELMFFAQASGSWRCGLWHSDARLLYCKLESGRFTHVIMVSGSFAEWRGRQFVSHASAGDTFEWLDRPEWKNVFSSQGNVAEDELVIDFEVFDSVP